VSSLSLHHWDEPEAAVPELARVLRPGGRLYIYDFPIAPFDRLARTARERSVLNGPSAAPARIRTGIPFLAVRRFALSAPAA
jgi:ubiquinone/menaquinone biosynthesis C-methylase UbiE